ncbi:MAG: hypothetical protein Q8M76_09015, partial [Spirochaetaceae bacterium]|nr:hypothetical protein [Spirochaetaceae bacterium]
MPLILIVAAILAAASSGLLGLAWPRSSTGGQRVSATVMAIAALAGLCGAAMSLLQPASLSASLPWPVASNPAVGIDALGSFFLV